MIRVVNVRGLRTPEQRAGVCYVGRGFAGWLTSPVANTFRPLDYCRGLVNLPPIYRVEHAR